MKYGMDYTIESTSDSIIPTDCKQVSTNFKSHEIHNFNSSPAAAGTGNPGAAAAGNFERMQAFNC